MTYRDRLARAAHNAVGRVPFEYASPPSRAKAYRVADAVMLVNPVDESAANVRDDEQHDDQAKHEQDDGVDLHVGVSTPTEATR